MFRIIILVLALVSIVHAQTTDEALAQLSSTDPTKRRLAAERLGQDKTVKAVPQLAELLRDADDAVRKEASDALVKIGRPSTPAVIKVLDSTKVELEQLRTITVLVKLGPEAEEAVPTLINFLKNPSTEVRILAATALGKIGAKAKAALPALTTAAKDTSNIGPVLRTDVASSVADAAATAALKINPKYQEALAKEILPDLIKALKSTDQGTVQAAAYALQRLGIFAKPAANALIEAEKNTNGFAGSVIATILDQIGARSPLDQLKSSTTPLEKKLAVLNEMRFSRDIDDRTISLLVSLLKDPNPKIRNRAAYTLGNKAPATKDAIPALIEAMADMELARAKVDAYESEPDIIPKALSQFGKRVVGDVAQVLKEPKASAFKQWNAAKTLALLGRMAEPALPVLQQSFKHPMPAVATESCCAYVLAGGRFAETTNILKQGLKQKEEFFLYQTIFAIERIGYPAREFVPELKELLGHKTSEIRIRAAHALAKMREAAKPAVPAMAELLSSKDSRERFQVTEAITNLGPEAADALPALLKRLSIREMMSPHPALLAIGGMGPGAKDAVPELIKLLQSKKENTADAIKVLGRIGPSAAPAVPSLITFLQDKDEYLRSDAAQALGLIGPTAREAIPALQKLLQDSKKSIRLKAITALILINNDSATYMPQLIELWNNSEDSDEIGFNIEHVRTDVAEVWELIGTKAAPAKDLMFAAITDEKTSLGTLNHLCKALANFKDETAIIVPKLVALLERPEKSNSSKYTYVHAVAALGKIGPAASPAIPAIRKLTDHEDKHVADTAYEALGKIEQK